MKRVTVVGGGFSGLVTSYYLARNGVPVTLIEKQERLGGMIDTLRTPYGPVETAASGIRSTARLEQLVGELGVPLVGTRPESRKRYLYRDGAPHQWPLGAGETIGMVGRLLGNVVMGRFRPADGETVERWGARVIGTPATKFILGAALQGIYAGDPTRMAAGLIAGKREKPAKGVRRGLVAPPVGLGELIDALVKTNEALGVEIRTGTEADPMVEGPMVVAISAADAAEFLRERAPETAKVLGEIEMVPLLRVTQFYAAEENTIPGFGILFAREQGIRALGVLFNTNIFPDRGEGHSESWIYGGGQDPEVLDLDDAALFEVVDRDRERLYGRRTAPIVRYPQRWRQGLPHYDLRLESILRTSIPRPDGVYLAGNYLRGIGLPMLLEQAWAVAGEINLGS